MFNIQSTHRNSHASKDFAEFFVCIVISVFILFPWNAQKAIDQSLPESTVQAAPAPSENPEPTPVPKSEIEQIKSKGKIVIAMVNKDNTPFFSQNKRKYRITMNENNASQIRDLVKLKAKTHAHLAVKMRDRLAT